MYVLYVCMYVCMSLVDLVFFFSDSEAKIQRSRNISALVVELHCFVILVLHTYIHTYIVSSLVRYHHGGHMIVCMHVYLVFEVECALDNEGRGGLDGVPHELAVHSESLRQANRVVVAARHRVECYCLLELALVVVVVVVVKLCFKSCRKS